MRMRSSSRQPSLAISHRRSCGQDKSNCQLRIMPEGMKKCTRFAPYGVEHHQAREYELRARDGCVSSACSLMETATAAAAAPGSYQWVAAVGYVCEACCLLLCAPSCLLGVTCILGAGTVWMQISRTRYRKSQELQPIKWKLPSVELSAQSEHPTHSSHS